jgi:LacI family transcriptional regulator
MKKSFTIGFLCPEIQNDFFMSIAKGVEDELRKNGYSLIICSSNESVREEKDRVRLLSEKRVDGIIIIPCSDKGEHFTRASVSGMPIVLADRLTDDFLYDAVLVDNINGCYTAVEHLINKGSRRIGFIGGDIRLTSAKERYQGYIRALEDYRIPIDESIVKFGDFHVQSGYSLMKELMQGANIPQYVFAANYYIHVGATKYLIESGCSIQDKVSLASFDDMELSSILGFCKLRVRQPVLEIGSRAAQLLISRINGEEFLSPQVIRLKAELVTKD